MSATILQRIVATKRDEIASAKAARPLSELRSRIRSLTPPRDFHNAIATDSPTIRLIAEIKKASPSAGLIRADFDPIRIANIYAESGASALSVLTDRSYFQGELAFIEAVKKEVPLPVLRKDFIIDAYQIDESRAAGADAVLLITAILAASQIEDYAAHAHELGMTSLIEIHDERELEIALPLITPARRTMLGINNRDLAVQQIDLSTTKRLAALLPAGTLFAAESGLKTRDDVQAMHHAGASAVLIGETFMRAPDIAAKVRELLA
ncbi:MAG: indole-3-glycerol phosphate synthase TrpC [Planctomycetes bacterium]|nr:indole-3-glycerol phosphate synthase TrpC [Planctomycetota bacterium]